jgi:hypothetical protein
MRWGIPVIGDTLSRQTFCAVHSGNTKGMTATLPRLQPPSAIGFNPKDVELPLIVEVHAGDAIEAIGGFLASRGQAQIVRVCASDCRAWPGRPAGAEAEAMLRLRLDDSPVYRLDQRCDALDVSRLLSSLTDLLSPGRWCMTAYAGIPSLESTVVAACQQTGARLVGYVPMPRPTGLAVELAYHLPLPRGLRRAKAAARRALCGNEMLAYDDEIFLRYR